jgi:uncharacterized protein
MHHSPLLSPGDLKIMRFVCLPLLFGLLCSFPAPGREEVPLKIVFIAGDDEYRSEEVLPFLAKLLGKNTPVKASFCYSLDPKDGTINPSNMESISGLDALDSADALVMFSRYRRLPDDQLKKITKFAYSGKPLVGFRTATHAFKYDAKHQNAEWNDKFGREVWGQKWITHHGHEKGEYLTAVEPAPAEGAEKSILQGVSPFKVPSWLYHVEGGGDSLFGDCKVLARGTSLVSSHERAKRLERYPITQPVAWTKTVNGKGRVFFTTLGHPHDFKEESMRKLTVNGMLWALGKPVPSGGANVTLEQPFDLSAPGVGAFRKNIKP